MAKKYFIPRSESKLSQWLRTFKLQISQYVATLGLTNAEETEMKNACDDLVNEIQNVYAAKRALKTAVTRKNSQKKKSLMVLMRAIAGIKTKSAYNDSIGKALGVIGPETVFDADTFKPRLRGRVFGGYVRINYIKDKADSMNFYGRIEGENEWTMIGSDDHPPFFDKRPLAVPGRPEARQYKAMGVVDDVPIGKESDVITVLFGG